MTRERKVSYWLFFKHRKSCMVFGAIFFSAIFFMFQQPIYGPMLGRFFGVPDDQKGFIIAIGPFFYMIGALAVGPIAACVDRKIIMFFAFIFSAFALMLFGPSELIFSMKPLDKDGTWEQNQMGFYLNIIGYAMLGIIVGFMLVPSLPEILYQVAKAEGIENDTALNDKATGMYNLVFALACAIAPVIGGAMMEIGESMELHGFAFTCDFMAICSFFFAFIFLFLAIGCKAFCTCTPEERPVKNNKEEEGQVKFVVEDLS